MKPSVKKFLIIALIVCAVLVVIGIVFGNDNEPTSDSKSTTNTTSNSSAATESPSQTTTSTTTANDTLGNYAVEIKSYRLAKDYEDAPIVIIKYLFTNNDTEAASFYLTFEDDVYQNGVGLNKCYFVDDSANYSADNQSKEIKKGSSIDVEIAYVLNDTTSDLEVEVSKLISFNNKKITKVFKLQ